jgi:DNA repair protein RecO (recombination protein O)
MNDEPIFSVPFDASPVGLAPADGADAVGSPKKTARRAPRVTNRVEDRPAFLLHSYPYRETSLILDVFTRSHGRVALVAKGAKRPHSALRSVLVSFQRLNLSWSGAGDIKTLIRAEWSGAPLRLQGSSAMSAWYLNELLLRLLIRDDPHEALYDAYVDAISRLAEQPRLSAGLREFEWTLLREIGYAFDPSMTDAGEPIHPDQQYRLPLEAGPSRIDDAIDDNWASRSAMAVSGRVLQALTEHRFDDALVEPELRRLLRERLDYHMSGRPLTTRQVLRDLQDYLP